MVKRKKKVIELDPCWKCEGVEFLIFRHKVVDHVIYACKNCYAPAKLDDLKGLRLMEEAGITNKDAAEYARTWREYMDTKRET